MRKVTIKERLTHYGQSPRHAARDFLLLGGLAAMTGLNLFLLFTFFTASVNEQVKLEIKVSEAVTVGESVIYKLHFVNDSAEHLQNAQVTWFLPVSDRRLSAMPAINDQAVMSFGTLAPADEGEAILRAQNLSVLHQPQKVAAIFSYQLDNSWRRHKKSVKAEFVPSDSAVTLSLNTPSAVVKNGNFDFNVTVANHGSLDLSPVGLKFIWPDGWRMVEAPNNFLDQMIWLDTVPAYGQTTLDFTGSLTGGRHNSDQPLSVELWLQKVAVAPVLKTTAELIVVESGAAVQILIDEQTTKSLNANQSYTVTLPLENVSAYPLKNLSILLVAEGAYLKPDSLRAVKGENWRRGVGAVTGESVRWSGETVEVLATLRPRERTVLQASFETRSINDSALPVSVADQPLMLTVITEYQLTAGNGRTQLIGPMTRWHINTEMILNSFARYYTVEGEQLGRGPLPPAVGQTTKYPIFWHLSNTIHPVRDVKVEAGLPLGVEFTGKVSASGGARPIYDAQSRMISWSVGRVEKLVGSLTPSLGATFELAITPADGQLGNILSLLEDTKISGYDEVTGEQVFYETKAINTELFYDQKAVGKGQVVP